ncbi:MAG: hypothetical protein ACFFCQ_00845 [Promethearchaeota archaeon]
MLDYTIITSGEAVQMRVDKRALKFRESLWTFTTTVLPKISPTLQPSIADIAWLIVNHFFTPVDNEELYLKYVKIWKNRPVESNPSVELLAICAWRIRLYLTYNQPEMAFKLFQQITKTVLHKRPFLDSELETCCLPTSKRFPLPKIPDSDISLLFDLGEILKQTKENLTLRTFTKQINIPFKELISHLQRLEMVFGNMVAFEALGLYWLRAEVKINSNRSVQPLIERFNPLAYRCELHSTLMKYQEGHENNIERFSIEFAYPIDQEDVLFEWTIKNKIKLYRKIKEQLYQNFNVLYKDPWHPMDVARSKNAFLITFKHNLDRITLNKQLLQIIEIYQKIKIFSKGIEIDEADCLLPFHKLGAHLKMDVAKIYQKAPNFFQQQILTPYFYSRLLGYTPEKVVEGSESLLHDEGKTYLYARGESLQPFIEEKKSWTDKIFRLYVPNISSKLIELYGFRALKRVFWDVPPYFVHVNRYNIKKSCWQYPKLPNIQDLLN